MSKARIMGAGNAGASKFIRLNGDVGGGDKKQGLVPLTNKSSRLYYVMYRANPHTQQNASIVALNTHGTGKKSSEHFKNKLSPTSDC